MTISHETIQHILDNAPESKAAEEVLRLFKLEFETLKEDEERRADIAINDARAELQEALQINENDRDLAIEDLRTALQIIDTDRESAKVYLEHVTKYFGGLYLKDVAPCL